MEKKNNLVEIKRGQTGRGLLVEQDGYMSLDETTRKNINESIDKEGGWFCPNPFIVSAVFQKYGIENHNGRIYPEEILKREVEKYQVKIQEKRAYGECYRPEAMILTRDGWKHLYEINEGDEVLTLNTDTNETEFQPILRVIKKHSDKLVNVHGKKIDDYVTEEHGYPVYHNKSFSGFVKTIDLLSHKDCFIPCGKDDPFSEVEYISDINLTDTDYDGDVMCVEVENHVWYVCDNGKCHWTKNCNHPDDSVIDLGRVCMNIIELHWEQHTLVGKIEIITSEAFRKSGLICCLGDTVANLLLSGLKIGVSSRSVGSVEQRFGKMIVGDDLELICWDVVSDPSTPGSFISTEPNGKDLQMYVEGDMTKEKKEKLFEKLDNFNSWLG